MHKWQLTKGLAVVAAWYDAWVGAFIDAAKHRLYIFPVPFLGFCIQFPTGPEWLPWKLKWLPVQRIRDLDGTLKLTRFKLTPPLGPLGQLYLHRFHAPETGMPMHDHAYNFWTIPLGVGYWETTRGENALGPVRAVYVPPWRLTLRLAEWAHVVNGPAPTSWSAVRMDLFPFWTLFWQGRQRRRWGFWLPVTANESTIESYGDALRWVYWKDYYAQRAAAAERDNKL